MVLIVREKVNDGGTSKGGIEAAWGDSANFGAGRNMTNFWGQLGQSQPTGYCMLQYQKTLNCGDKEIQSRCLNISDRLYWVILLDI